MKDPTPEAIGPSTPRIVKVGKTNSQRWRRWWRKRSRLFLSFI